MSDGSKNFSLRLSPDDQARLEQVAERLARRPHRCAAFAHSPGVGRAGTRWTLYRC